MTHWFPFFFVYFLLCSQEGDVEIERLLLLEAGVPVDALLTKKDFSADNVWTPAGIAVHNKRVEVAKLLIDHGCNQQFTTCNSSLSLLHIAAVHNLGDLLGYMLLHAATKHGRCDVDLLARDHTAMAMAANRCHRDAVIVLSCFGAARPSLNAAVHEDVLGWMTATEGFTGLQCPSLSSHLWC
jgi:ankyrin repeat protein